jgi:ERCC4-type nuclease
MQGAVITVTLVFGIPLLRSTCPRETADLILWAANQLQRRAKGGAKRPGYHPKGLTQQQSFLLQAIPEIGPAKAKLLLEAFAAPVGVASATIEELQAVHGIGHSAATKINQVFHGRQPCDDVPSQQARASVRRFANSEVEELIEHSSGSVITATGDH